MSTAPDLFGKNVEGPSDQVRGTGAAVTAVRPLADVLRPENLSDVVGQDHLVGADGTLTIILQNLSLGEGRGPQDASGTGPSGQARGTSTYFPSLILWGPPGCGKTTIARILARDSGLHFEQLSAVFSGVADLKRVFDAARVRATNGTRTLLFVDEIHRFNKAQQDAFLPVVEDGTITLIGATTENPSFELNGALLSRAQVVVLKRLDDAALELLLQRAETYMERALPLDQTARATLKALADGDGRYMLGLVEQIYAQAKTLNEAGLLAVAARRRPLYDKSDDGHYNLISALHKSVRGSDVDAALYWFARMLDGGEEPRYIARRMVRMAIEDIGLADPQALQVTLNAWEAYERLGSPEGELALSEALIYVATAPKSNANYTAYKAARGAARDYGSLMPPKIILNAPTKMMQEQEYGAGYIYDHDTDDAFSGQNYFPDGMARTNFYTPVERGFERDLNKRLDYWAGLRAKKDKS